MLQHPVVEVLSTQVGIPRSSTDLKDCLCNGEDGYIEGASAHVKDEDVGLRSLVALLVKTICYSSRRWFIHNPKDIQTRNVAGILCCLALGIVEIRGHCDNRVPHSGSQVSLRGRLHLDEDHGGDLLSLELLGLSLVVNLNDGGSSRARHDLERPVLHVGLDTGVGELAANQPLGVEHGVGGVHGDLVLGSISDETLGLIEGDIRGGGAVSLVIGDDLDTVVLPHSDARVGGSEVNSDRFSGNC
mmetsp:Transcript_42660/g.102046  ORF Transcript_42660/g.102046 Transcript_42660/m.102046 type:complete len:244 (-) Transcript_42660:30-761(-)